MLILDSLIHAKWLKKKEVGKKYDRCAKFSKTQFEEVSEPARISHILSFKNVKVPANDSLGVNLCVARTLAF